MDEAPCSCDGDTLEALAHSCDSIFVIGKNANVGITAPEKDLPVFVTSEKDVALAGQRLVKLSEILVGSVGNNSKATDRL